MSTTLRVAVLVVLLILLAWIVFTWPRSGEPRIIRQLLVPVALTLLAIAAAIAGLRGDIGMLGGVRQRPVRVSDVNQQGNVEPNTLVLGHVPYFSATVAGHANQYHVFTYDSGRHATVKLGNHPFERAPRLLHATNKKPYQLFFTLTDDPTLWVCTEGGVASPTYSSIPAGAGTTAPTRIFDIQGGYAGVIMLGLAEDRLSLFRVRDDASAFDTIAHVSGVANARFLRVGKHVSVIAFVVDTISGVRIMALRDDSGTWDTVLDHPATSIAEVVEADGTIFFERGDEHGASSLWRSDANLAGHDLGVVDPHHLTAATTGVYAAGANESGTEVYFARATDSAAELLRFRGATAASDVVGILVESDQAAVLADHASDLCMWHQADNELQQGTSFGSSVDDPRSLTKSSSGYCCLGGHTELWIEDERLSSQGVARNARAERLIAFGAEVLFAAEDAEHRVSIFSSYLRAR